MLKRIIFLFSELRIIRNLGSGKSSALTPHMDALNRTLAQMDLNQEYIQHPNKSIDLLFEQPFIVSNVTCILNYLSDCLFFSVIVNSTSSIPEFVIWQSFIVFNRVRYVTIKFGCLWQSI